MYSGQWRNGNQDGKGRIDYSTGGYYEGDFVEGMRHGDGILVSALGSQYRGSFKHNNAHGTGTCTNAGKSKPCQYRNNKLVKATSVATTATRTATVALAAVATETALAKEKVAAPTTAQPVAPRQKPTPAPATVSRPAKPEHKAAAESPPPAPAPVAKPFVAATAVAANTAPAAAKASSKQKYAAATMAIPNSKQQFTQTLSQEKQKLKHLTVADLRQDRSDIYFSDNWEAKDLMAIPEQAWWQKRASLFSDAVYIVSRHGDTELRMVIADYKGPGTYTIKEAVVTSESADVNATTLESGTIVVESEQGDWISGSFQFEVKDDDKGQQLAFHHGAFRLSTKDNLPVIRR